MNKNTEYVFQSFPHKVLKKYYFKRKIFKFSNNYLNKFIEYFTRLTNPGYLVNGQYWLG